ncbi:FAD-dependent oxidoreductase [Negadavirga shengliensis]|uniref:D-amino-acid oxidase n=1 Tax=Negadavirga shengliensis TaxID=1389218 RepID=A0ABV9T0L7_9BACT
MSILRRDFIKKVSLATLAAGGFGCPGLAFPHHSGVEIYPPIPNRLPKVLVSKSRIIKQSVGLRPYRKSGPRIELQELGNKKIIHNYGHGGSGWSLSWGSAMLASELVAQTGISKVAVMGCGVVGLSTARTLQNQGYEVTIYTKEVYPNITSAMATGTWSPTHKLIDPDKITSEFQTMFKKAYMHSFNTYQRMLGLNRVVDWMDTYNIRSGEVENSNDLRKKLISPDMDFYPKPIALKRRENPFKYKEVRKGPTNIFNIPSYLKMLTDDFLLAGGKIKVKSFKKPEEVDALPQQCIVNCTGLGAMEIFGDDEMSPVSGQLCFLVPQRELNYRANMAGIYFIPRRDGIMIGGNHIENNWNTDPDPAVTDRFLDGVSEMMKNLRR